jgi:hypothetical protein
MHIETVRQSDGKTEAPIGSDDNGLTLVAAMQSNVEVEDSPTITAGAYSSGNVMGGIRTLALFRLAGGSGVLTDLFITDKGNQKAPLTILFFESLPAQTYTDKAACPALTTDVPALVGQLLVAAADYTTTGGIAVAHKSGLALNMANADVTPGKNLYAVLVTTGTPTPASTSDLTFSYRMNRN